MPIRHLSIMKSITRLLSVLAALFVSLPAAKAAEFTWSTFFPYVYSFSDQGWLWYSTLGTDGIYAITLDGPNKDAFVELVAPTPSNAPTSIAGKTFSLSIDGENVTVQYNSDGTFIESGIDDGTPYTETGSYSYYKTGPNGGIIIADFDSEVALLTVVLDFATTSSGTLNYKFVSATIGDADSASASFTVQ